MITAIKNAKVVTERGIIWDGAIIIEDGKIKEYKISILRSMPYGSATKGLAIQITDPVLLEKTGCFETKVNVKKVFEKIDSKY